MLQIFLASRWAQTPAILKWLASLTVTTRHVASWKTAALDIVFEAVLYAVAVRDVNTDPMLKCLTARRTDLDLEVPSATYVWSLNAGEDQPRKNATLYFTPAPSDATARLVVNSDVDHPDYVRYLYTDEECGIMEVHYFGYQCTLWVPEIVGDTIPEHCLWVHAMICGEGVPLYDKKVCTENLE
ncbi:uncharacterized protein LOC144097148 isoform X2 [Amblyomma americanum]